jgi:hypothetical protein
MEIHCEYRSLRSDNTPLCRIVSELSGISLEICETNDSACEFCLKCGVAPQVPNRATASMIVRAHHQTGTTPASHVTQVLRDASPPPTLGNIPCVFRSQQLREQACKPCQAGGRVPVMVPVFRCNSGKYSECTLRNTGTVPKIQACITCEHRLPEYPRLLPLEVPRAVLDAMNHP